MGGLRGLKQVVQAGYAEHRRVDAVALQANTTY
jgi:hypothetical protein